MWNATPSPGFKFRPRKGIWTDGQNNTFDPDTFEAKSYQWWTYVAKIKGKVVFNAYPYSHSTQNHQRNMRALLKQLKIKVDVTVSMRQSLSKFWSDSLPNQYEELFKIEIEAKRARRQSVWVESHSYTYKTRAEAIEALKESIRVSRQLGAKMSREAIKELKKQLIESDAKRLEDARIQRAETNALRLELKPKLNDLGPVSMEVFEKNNDLNEIQLNEGVSNV